MSHGVDSNAMTETALGLAMAFFSIMVLAMVSMGVQSPAAPGEALSLADQRPEGAGNAAQQDASARRLLVHWRGRLLDHELRPIDQATLAGPLTLAVAPDLSLAQAMRLRHELARHDILIATLDQAWLTRLQETFP